MIPENNKIAHHFSHCFLQFWIKLLPKVSINWILKFLLKSCFIITSITNIFLVMLDMTYWTQDGSQDTILLRIYVWSLGIIFIHLVPNERLNAVFSTGQSSILVTLISAELYKIFGGYLSFITLLPYIHVFDFKWFFFLIDKIINDFRYIYDVLTYFDASI